MSALLQDLAMLLFAVLLSLAESAYGASADDFADGWHSWEVPASANGTRACCHYVRSGRVGTEGCRLGSGAEGLTIDNECEPASDKLRVYVLVEGGDVAEIHALSAACPVSTSTPVRSAGARDPDWSIAWLDRHARDGSRLAEDAVAAIALHDDASALPALTTLIEDRGRGMDVREVALFWLAQSDSDEAFRYLDRLLSRR